MDSNMVHRPLSRRRVMQASAWSVPAVALATAAPSTAVSIPLESPGDLSIAVMDPSADGERNTPVYWGDTMRVAQHGDLPPGIVITNVGSTEVQGASGTLEIQMQNMDGGSHIAYRTQAREYVAAFVLVDTTPAIPPTEAARTYRWTLAQPIRPGESVTIPLEYFTPRIFANGDFSVLVLATVEDAVSDDANDMDARVGFVPGYATSLFGP